MNKANLEPKHKSENASNSHQNFHFKQTLWLSIKIDNLERNLSRLRRENKKIEDTYIELAKKRYITILVEDDEEIKLLKHQLKISNNKKECKKLMLNLFILRQQKQEQLLSDSTLKDKINGFINNDELLRGEGLRYQHRELVLQARIEVTKKLFKKLQHDKSLSVIPHYWLELFSKLQSIIHYLPTKTTDAQHVENFLNELVDIDGKPLYQKLRDERLENIKKYEVALNNTSAFVINLGDEEINNDTIMNAVSKLPTKMQNALAKALWANNIIFEECNKKLDCDIDILIDAMLYTNNLKAVKILFNAGISQYIEYYSSFPLYKAIQHNNRALALIILNDKNIDQVLKYENDNKKYCLNSLELLIYIKDIELIKLIINNRFGSKLIEKANKQGNTPIDICYNLNNHLMIQLLKEALSVNNYES